MNVAITGATGFVGSHVVERLCQMNHRVTCLVRKTSNLRWIEHLPIQRAEGSLSSEETLRDFVSDADVIIHCAGLTKARDAAEYYQVNAEGTRHLLEATKKAGKKSVHFILVSSQAAAGPSPEGIPLRESDPPQPITAYGKSKLRAEAYTREFSGDFPTTILRPPAVYGPRDQDVFLYFKFVRYGLKPMFGYTNRVSIVYVENLVEGIIRTMANPKAYGQTYFIADEGFYYWSELADMISRALNKKTIPLKIPRWMIRVVAAAGDAYSRIFRRAILLNKEKLLELQQPYWMISTEKAKAELGFVPPYSTETAIRKTAQWYVEQGWL